MRKVFLSLILIICSFFSYLSCSSDYEYTLFKIESVPSDDIVESQEDTFTAYEDLNKQDIGKIADDYFAMKEINSETVGWLNIPNICYYPVMYSGDQKYLHTDIYGDYLYSGTLFMGKNSLGSFDNMALIYGHHMKDGTMFAGLTQYKNEYFFNNNDLIELFDGKYLYKYKVYTVFNIVDGEEFIEQNPLQDRADYFESLYNRSLVKGTAPDFDANMLFFQTCDYLGYDNCRLIVGSYLIEKIEY